MQVDDYPYGGGWGLVMMAQPLKSCLGHILRDAGERRTRVIYMSPQAGPSTRPRPSASGATTTTLCSSAATTRA